jgi:hypothetical protein
MVTRRWYLLPCGESAVVEDVSVQCMMPWLNGLPLVYAHRPAVALVMNSVCYIFVYIDCYVRGL